MSRSIFRLLINLEIDKKTPRDALDCGQYNSGISDDFGRRVSEGRERLTEQTVVKLFQAHSEPAPSQ